MSNARELAELSGSYGTGGFVGMKNRIINGAMMIDQRNLGASITPTTASQFSVDRWSYLDSQASKVSLQQSSVAPAGFKNSVLITSLSSYAISSTDYFVFRQFIEGYNVSDLGYGAAGAATITVSFWVRSSLTGSFGGSLLNALATRNYPFSYTINAANTWEQKTITIAGDTTGTWATDNTQGLGIQFSLGVGATYSGTANAWTGTSNIFQPTGSTSVVGTSGATFYITGVQLEKGSTATSFDYRDYGREMYMCKRYYHRINNTSTYIYIGNGRTINSTYGDLIIYLPATMRAQPSMSYSNIAHFQCAWAGTCTTLSLSGNQSNNTVDTVLLSVGPGTTNSTSVQILQFNAVSSSAYLDFSAEL